jgi:drug/metabolite transporter (DMT)-like permease
MALRDFALFILVCFIWGLNTVFSKIMVSDLGVPPLFYATIRSATIAVAVCPWLLPMPRPHWRIVVVGVLMGGGGFALLFLGLKTASPSAASIVSQLGVPMTTVLSIFILGERVGWKRGLGIALALSGVLLVMWDPEGMELSTGLFFAAGSAFTGALGAVMMKQMTGIRPLQFQAWVGFSSMFFVGVLSGLFETDQVAAATHAGWAFVAILLYSALVVSVLAHTTYYGLIQRYDANLVAPLTLMSPLFTIGLGIMITHDHFDARMALGTVVALFGVFIIAVRPSFTLPKAVLFRNRT